MKQGGHSVAEVIGHKTLIKYCGRNEHGHHMWLSRCNNCGSECPPSSISHIKRASHCGVCQRWRENNGRWLGYKELSGSWLYQYRSDAKKKGRTWDVTPEQLWELWLNQDGKCAYTGWNLTHGKDASLDRIDSSMGYTIDNVQWVHRDINRMKSDFTESYFLKLVKAISKQ